ncbi:hypothetical protein D3C72_2598510 [compost metagenome]
MIGIVRRRKLVPQARSAVTSESRPNRPVASRVAKRKATGKVMTTIAGMLKAKS